MTDLSATMLMAHCGNGTQATYNPDPLIALFDFMSESQGDNHAFKATAHDANKYSGAKITTSDAERAHHGQASAQPYFSSKHPVDSSGIASSKNSDESSRIPLVFNDPRAYFPRTILADLHQWCGRISRSDAAITCHRYRPSCWALDRSDVSHRTRPAIGVEPDGQLALPLLNHQAFLDTSPTGNSRQDDWASAVYNHESWPRVSSSVPPAESATHRFYVDHESLPVDDSRREFDFATFVTELRQQRIVDRAVPGSVDGSKAKKWIERRKHEFVHERNSRTDIQGLNWRHIGISRETAIDARRMLHHSYRKESPSSPAEQQDAQNEKYFGFRIYAPQHRVHYNHYQLRHVLAATSRDAIFYVDESSVIQASLACSSAVKNVFNLSSAFEQNIRVTCLAASTTPRTPEYRGSSFVLAGDFDGGYSFFDLEAENRHQDIRGCVSQEYDGLVSHISTHIQRQSGLPQATFCSNDCKVRRMDVRTQRFTGEYSNDYAMNCTSMSPDGRLELLVGDSNNALVRDADTGDLLATLKAHADHNFACAWSPEGIYNATGSQDGLVALWDCRNWAKPLRTFTSAVCLPRSLHFTDDGLLVSVEEDDCVSVFRTNKLDDRQDIRFFGSVAGAVLLDGGKEMVVANADKTVGGLLSFRRTASGPGGGDTHSSSQSMAEVIV